MGGDEAQTAAPGQMAQHRRRGCDALHGVGPLQDLVDKAQAGRSGLRAGQQAAQRFQLRHKIAVSGAEVVGNRHGGYRQRPGQRECTGGAYAQRLRQNGVDGQCFDECGFAGRIGTSEQCVAPEYRAVRHGRFQKRMVQLVADKRQFGSEFRRTPERKAFTERKRGYGKLRFAQQRAQAQQRSVFALHHTDGAVVIQQGRQRQRPHQLEQHVVQLARGGAGQRPHAAGNRLQRPGGIVQRIGKLGRVGLHEPGKALCRRKQH